MKSIFLIVGLFGCVMAKGQDSISVLWIGNSYTYVNDLPEMLNQLTFSLGDKLSFDSKTNGGYTFQNHWNDPATYTKISSKPWDYVILQGQSQEPSFPTSQVNTQTLPYATYLADSVYSNKFCSQAMYFMTWGRENGDPQWDSINTFNKMNSRLRDAYVRIRDSAEASVSPVGSAWRYVRENHPNIQLYSGDGSHPSVEGSYLAASVFYASLFRKSPVGAAYISTLDPATALLLQEAAAICVLDSLDTWKLRANNETAIAQFTYSQNQNSVQFYNSSWRESSIHWDFGDGSTSADEQINHTYTATGSYTVSLIASNECGEDTLTQAFIIDILNLPQTEIAFKIYTLESGYYQITGAQGPLVLTDTFGRVLRIIEDDETPLILDLRKEAKGIYILSSPRQSYRFIR